MTMRSYSVLDICAGAGGQSLGLERAGFIHAGAVEIDAHACQTLRKNRPGWKVLEADINDVDGRQFRGVDLIAGGVPCPPFSIAGKQLGKLDERDLFPQALRLAEEAQPAAIMLENVRGLAGTRFEEYRRNLLAEIEQMGYEPRWRVLNASNYGVSQLRPRFVLIALKRSIASAFHWPDEGLSPPTVGELLKDMMAAGGWRSASRWAKRAAGIAPTIVGGSKKHGGPDLGPTRAREEWKALGVDGRGLADAPPPKDFPSNGMPRLTVAMVARLQGFPDAWQFVGGKTSAYRQVGNAFPPPVALAVGNALVGAIAGGNGSHSRARLQGAHRERSRTR